MLGRPEYLLINRFPLHCYSSVAKLCKLVGKKFGRFPVAFIRLTSSISASKYLMKPLYIIFWKKNFGHYRHEQDLLNPQRFYSNSAGGFGKTPEGFSLCRKPKFFGANHVLRWNRPAVHFIIAKNLWFFGAKLYFCEWIKGFKFLLPLLLRKRHCQTLNVFPRPRDAECRLRVLGKILCSTIFIVILLALKKLCPMNNNYIDEIFCIEISITKHRNYLYHI